MYGPLFEAEHCEGLTTWRVGQGAFVGCLVEAHPTGGKLWKVGRRRTLERTLAAWNAEKIPSHFNEVVNRATQASIPAIPIGPQRHRFEYEVGVLGKRLARAEEAIKKIVDMPDFDDWG